MWIKRELEQELKKVASHFPIVVITGPRQVGKTSLCERAFPNYGYCALDAGANAEMAETRPMEFLERHHPPVILDEIQYVPSFFRFVKQLVDEHRDERGLFILSGSQNFVLMQSVSESLAGRAAVISLYGLSGREFMDAFRPEGSSMWFNFLWKGGFPGLWKDPQNQPSRDRWYQGYVATYLERDIRNLLKVGRLRDFERFLRACAIRVGSPLNMSEIGRDVGISATTSREWMSILMTSGQIFLLEPYYRSLGKRITKSPKLYFTDTGLLAYLLGFQSEEGMVHSPSAGAIWENYCVIQWLRWRDWHSPATGLWFWRDRSGNEVDLLLEMDQRLIPIECKFKERPTTSDAKGIERLRRFYGDELVADGFVACLTQEPFDLNDHVTAMPGWSWWEVPPPSPHRNTP